MKTRTGIIFLVLLSLTVTLWALSPQTTTTVQADDPPRATRQGGWLDAVVFTEEDTPEDAVSLLQADALDLYGYSSDDPALFQRVLEDPGLEHTLAHGSYNGLMFNPYGPEFYDGRLNPFSSTAIREGMNRLIDRTYVSQVICGGMARPRLLPVQTVGADYARYLATIQALEAAYAHDAVAAEAEITAGMVALGAEMVDDKWHYGGEPVTIIALIRLEDERLQLGDYAADLLEGIGFTVQRDYRTSAAASPCWLQGDPGEGCFHFYTEGWVSSAISRDDGSNFAGFYTPLGFSFPPWQAYNPSPAFLEAAQKLLDHDFASMAERDTLFEQALGLSMNDSGAGSLHAWLKEDIGFTARRAGTAVASDRASGVLGAQMWPYVARFDGIEGGAMRVAIPIFLEQPWNPVAGGNWYYDSVPIRFTQDHAFIQDPNDGLVWPQRAERAELVVQDGLPVGKTHDWIDLSFVPEITVPGDAWVDWDATTQTFITAADQYPGGLTARVKSTVVYPADLFSTVTWHDGSPLDLSDIVMNMILTFDRAKPDSPIYDESAVGDFDGFMANFRGVQIESTDPLVITTYSDRFELDAELSLRPWWPNYGHGPGAWHNLAAAIRAEAAEQLAFSQGKANTLGVPWADFTAGPSLPILEGWMDLSATEGYIPYLPTLGAYVDPAEVAARWANLQAWHAARGHFLLGTGPYFLDSADPDADTLTLLHYPAFPDEAGRWDAFAADPAPDLAINYDSGAPGSYFTVTGSGFPPDSTASIVANDNLLGQVPVDGSGEIAFTLTTGDATPGPYHLRVTVNPSGGVAFEIGASEPVRPKEGDLQEVAVPQGLTTQIYLPVVLQSWP